MRTAAAILIVVGRLCSARGQNPIYKSQHFVVYPDRVIEGE